MELKEFIKTTLLQISEGIKEAQEEIDGSDMIINPAKVGITSTGEKYLRSNGARYIQSIEINVGVTAIEKEGGKAGIGIITGVLSGGAQSSRDNSNQSYSTIKFEIPVALPSTPASTGNSGRNTKRN